MQAAAAAGPPRAEGHVGLADAALPAAANLGTRCMLRRIMAARGPNWGTLRAFGVGGAGRPVGNPKKRCRRYAPDNRLCTRLTEELPATMRPCWGYLKAQHVESSEHGRSFQRRAQGCQEIDVAIRPRSPSALVLTNSEPVLRAAPPRCPADGFSWPCALQQHALQDIHTLKNGLCRPITRRLR
jgi:hypothetical protein